jgi:hypothetical protein
MIEIQPRDDLEHRLWRTVLELADRQPEGWTLIGAQMVMLHAWEHGAVPTRTSRDLDVLVNIKALAGGTQQFARQLLDVGFELGVVTPDGRGHRFVRGEIMIDVLAADNLGRPGRPYDDPSGLELEKMGFRPISAFPSLEILARMAECLSDLGYEVPPSPATIVELREAVHPSVDGIRDLGGVGRRSGLPTMAPRTRLLSRPIPLLPR